MKFAFFSRKNGFLGGFPVRVYTSHTINDPSCVTLPFIGMTGKEILSLKNNIYLLEKGIDKNILHKNANENLNWYYYSVDTVFTDLRTLN